VHTKIILGTVPWHDAHHDDRHNRRARSLGLHGSVRHRFRERTLIEPRVSAGRVSPLTGPVVGFAIATGHDAHRSHRVSIGNMIVRIA